MKTNRVAAKLGFIRILMNSPLPPLNGPKSGMYAHLDSL
jgi:hypothetical protein